MFRKSNGRTMIASCHIISGLQTGGAERMLVRLLEGQSNGQVVICLGNDGPQGSAMRKMGVPVYVLGHRIWKLLSLLARLHPEVVVGWMYHGNIVAMVMGWLWRKPVVWNVRHSVNDLSQEKPSLRWVIRVGAWCSLCPRTIVYNSVVAAEQHNALGYAAANARVLPNGLDTSAYCPIPEARKQLVSEQGLSAQSFIIGHLARFHPMKDHLGFLDSAALLAKSAPDVHFVLAGRGVDNCNIELLSAVNRLGLSGKVQLLGERDDVARLLSAFHVFVLSSAWGEGFPNVLLEAMACGVPVVTTDVGDARFVVQNMGKVVPPADSRTLAAAMKEMYDMDRAQLRRLGLGARQRVVETFDIRDVVQAYHATWEVT